MADPFYELQAAIVPRLKGFAALVALIADRVYDHVPADGAGEPTADFPYVSMGAADGLEDDAECIDGMEISFRIDAWSRTPGYGEVMKIGGAVRNALHGYDINLTDNALVELRHRSTRRMRDPDGLTSHAVIEFTAMIEMP